MEFDLATQPEIVRQAASYGLQVWELAKDWFVSRHNHSPDGPRNHTREL